VRPQWREAAESIGATTWRYWRQVAGPLLLPAFLGSTLLLFANAFSSYATAAALISQGRIILPLQIDGALTSEVVLNQANLAKGLALGRSLDPRGGLPPAGRGHRDVAGAGGGSPSP
jgi:putative spermidine/putrescine transport system permease protein